MVTESERVEAAFIDTVYRAADRDDVDYYVDRAGAANGPVLELGCGGGRIYLELLAAGVDADGIDLSAASLALLRERADREYALVTCPFNAVQELTTITHQRALLASAYDALAPGGRFVFDTFVPDFEYIAEVWGEWQERTVEFRGVPHEFHTRSRLVDAVTQTYVSEKRAVAPDGEELFAFEGRATLLPYREIELLVRGSPFESWAVTGDYSDESLTDGHSAQVWSLERTE